MLSFILSLLGVNPLGRILDSIDRHGQDMVDKDKLKSDAIQTVVKAQASVLAGPGWWFPVFFIAPLGFWFAAVCIYSVFWCAKCAYPQTWTIAALPPPLDTWGGYIITSLFLGATGMGIMARWK